MTEDYRAVEYQPVRDYLVSLTAAKRRDRGPRRVLLRTFAWSAASGWGVNHDRLQRRLERGDSAAVDDVVSAMLSRRHGRLSPERNAWRLGRGVDVPVDTLWFILDAHRAAGRHSVDVDDLKVIVSQLGKRISRFGELTPEQRQHAQGALYKEILERCVNFDESAS